ncbi:MAG: IS66 family insertion sequence element accessory protein TnpB [Rubrivivax sp.]
MLNGAGMRAYVCAEAVDLRKSIDGLCALVGPVFAADPFSGHWFVFLSRNRTKVKILYWDRHGFALWYKRLERGRYPSAEAIANSGLSMAELNAYLEGIDLKTTRRLAPVHASRIA